MKTNQSQTAPAEARENIMGTMEINPLLLKLSIPMMISMLVQALYNVVDSVFVSHVSENALTAVSLAFSLQNVMIAVGVGTGVGVNALLSKSLGEKNQSRANTTAENGIFLSLCSFAVFFGGSAADIPAAAILACLICWMDRRGFYKKANQLLFYLLCSMLTGFLGCVLVRMGVGVHLDKILIGCIMLTIPGISITYAMRDMLLGESITGLFRFIESLLIAATIAGGFLLSTVVAEGVLG